MPKIVDAEKYRKELLDKCFDLFANRGYANVTTRQIAEELGVSTGTLYHYFSNKQTLFVQLVEQISLQDVAILQSIDRGLDIVAKIRELGRVLLENEEYIIKQAAIWDNFYQQESASAIAVEGSFVFKEADKRYERALLELLELNDPQVAKFIWTLVDGILYKQIGDRDSVCFATQVELLVQMLIAYFEKYILS